MVLTNIYKRNICFRNELFYLEPNDLLSLLIKFKKFQENIKMDEEYINISKIIFEPLVTLTSDYKIEMCLAKECVKQNETTYLIKLRNDRKWADGQKFTANDVRLPEMSIKPLTMINTDSNWE